MSLSAPKNYTTRSSNIKKNKRDIKLQAYDHGKKLYQKYYSNPNNFLLNQLKQNYLTLYLNNLSLKDVSIMNEILLKYFYFQQIELSTYDPQKVESSSKKYRTNKEIKEKQDKLRNMTNKIMIGISKHLSLSKSIINICLANFELMPKYCEFLSKGLIDNKSLQGLKITKCKIDLKSYELLLKGLLNHIALTYLDLSNNNLGDRYGNIISRIIIRQAQRRDQIIWSYGLRNERPLNNDYKKGLISINISGNKLGRESAETIANALSTDQYLRAIYLNDNKIENPSCKKFIYMMRKNLCLLTIDLRNNPGYDEFIHSRLVMKMSKNIRYLYQQYKKGEYSEEDFENYKEFIDATFFDVDIPQEIVEFYNNNLPETSEENPDNENEDNEQIESELKEEDQKKEEDKVLKNNYIEENNDDRKEIMLKNKQLFDENLKLKQEIIELKAKNLQQQLGNDNKKNGGYKETESDIDSYYHRVEELINELNDIMNKIESKKLKHSKTNTSQNKKNVINTNKDDHIEIKINEQSNQINREQGQNMPKKLQEEKKEKEREREREKEEKINVKKEQNKKDIINININDNNNKDEKKDEMINLKKEKEKEREREKEKEKEKEREREREKEREKERENDNKILIKNEEEEEEKNNNEKKDNVINKDLEPLPYPEMLAEPSEREKEATENNNSHFEDEEGNIYNYDDLTEEEKMVIIQQQLILQRLQEEAEARGEQFDPQEYIEFLERQAIEEEEEEELKEGKSSNKLNKSF